MGPGGSGGPTGPGGPGPGWAPEPPGPPGPGWCPGPGGPFWDVTFVASSPLGELLKLSCIFLVIGDLMCNPHWSAHVSR